MSKFRYWSMYVTSVAIGYAVAGVLWVRGHRWREPLAVSVDRVARGHAEDAEHKVGPYLAPLSVLAMLGALVALILLI